jgi:hypothetical protein
MGDGSLQSHSGANLNPKTAKDRVDVPKGGEADGVALTIPHILPRSVPGMISASRSSSTSPIPVALIVFQQLIYIAFSLNVRFCQLYTG